MRPIMTLMVGVLLGTQPAVAFEPGEKVVVVRPTEMKTISGSILALTPGTTLTVQAIEGDRLKVAVDRVGRIDPRTVVTASKADAHFSDLIAHDPQDAVALMARGKRRFDNAALDSAKLAVAIADLDQSLKLAPSSEALTIRGFAWKRKGDKERAMADFDEAIKLNPKESLAWRVRGATWASKGDYQKALDHYTESIRIDPENPDSLHHRVMLQSICVVNEIRNGKQAVEDATKACELSEWKTPLYLQGLACAYAETGDFDSAIKWQTKVIELSGQGKDQLEKFRQHKPIRNTWK